MGVLSLDTVETDIGCRKRVSREIELTATGTMDDLRAIGAAEAVEDVVALLDHTGELHDVDVTIGLLRHFLMHSPHASVNPAVAASVKGYLKLQQARLRTLQRTLKRPWRRVAGKRFRSVLARAVATL
ncbi:MAG: hypothetical protein Q7W02_18800 [Candidatus Rokubacteria bacterium]|nr:hypothetical protein [Candidatus Rokubacteria bacterium]